MWVITLFDFAGRNGYKNTKMGKLNNFGAFSFEILKRKLQVCSLKTD